MFAVCLLMFPICMFILMPVYRHAGGDTVGGQTLPTLTLGNVESKSDRLWASLIAELALCIFVFLRIGHVYRIVGSLANDYHTRDEDAAYCVMITNIEKQQ